MKKKKEVNPPLPYGSGKYDYDDSTLNIYGINTDTGEIDDEEEADFQEWLKSVSNNRKRKE